MAHLDGVWDVERRGGLLPPLAGMRKRIGGNRGVTLVGPARMSFDVHGNELHYRRPFQGFVDVLEPSGDDAFPGVPRSWGGSSGLSP